MNKSPEIKNIASALDSFHQLVEPVTKDATNPFFKSKYSTLDNILSVIKKPLSDCGLQFSQFPDGNGLTTILMHQTGEWIEATYSVPLSKQDPQGAGSAITYMRRYALGAILGLATEVDDDANSASTEVRPKGKAKVDDDIL